MRLDINEEELTTRASLFLVFILFISCGSTTTTNAASVFNSSHKAKSEDDLYWILGVKKRTATIDDLYKRHIDDVPRRHIPIRIHHPMQMKIFDSGYQQSYLSLHAGDRIFAFDTRLDTFPGATRASFHDVLVRAKEVLLLDVVVTTDTAFMIHTRHCVDLSTRCHGWTLTRRGSDNGQCALNPEFMHNICPYTCGVCNERRYWTLNIFHRPLHMFPQCLHCDP